MNIQIFGRSKCFDTKKAQRYFSERKQKYQYIDLGEKPMSRGEFNSVCAAVSGADTLLDDNCKDKELLALARHLLPDARAEKLFENQKLVRTPIVRNGKKATVGYAPDVWKQWE